MTDKKNRKEKNQGETKKTDKKRAKSTGKNLQGILDYFTSLPNVKKICRLWKRNCSLR